MTGEAPPPIDVYNNPAIYGEAPETPKPVVSKTGEIKIPLRDSEEIIDPRIPIVTFGEAMRARENRIEQKTKTLLDEAAEAVLRYIEKQGLFVDKEPEELLRIIKHSELFENEISHILRTASEGEHGLEQNPTDVSTLVTTQKDKTGELIETQQGFYIQPSVTLLNDPQAQHAWKHDYFYNFQDRDTWQRIFPGTEPTLLQQAEADRIMSEAESIASDLQKYYAETRGYYDLTPERAAQIDKLLHSMNINPDEFAEEIGKDIVDAYFLLHETDDLNDAVNLAPLVNADMIREITLRTVASKKASPDDLQKSLKNLKNYVKTFHQFKDIIEKVPKGQRNTPDFYLNLKEQIGDDAYRQFLVVKEATERGSVNTESIENEIFSLQSQEQARKEYRELMEKIQNSNEQ